MSRFYSYINNALLILRQYDGAIPFSIFLKQHFAAHKKYGSKDRKQIAALCYSYFRTSLLFQKNLSQETLLAALFLCAEKDNQLLSELKPAWAAMIESSPEKKLSLINPNLIFASIFPYQQLLSSDIDYIAFCKAQLRQPGFFVRVRPGYESLVARQLQTVAATDYTIHNDHCIEFAAGFNIAQIFTPDKEVVIQDKSSAQTLYHIQRYFLSHSKNNPLSVWDCCAASGGKSMLAYDITGGNIQLTVSDIRASVLQNLRNRFLHAGITDYQLHTGSPAQLTPQFKHTGFDIILCDAPCTGSGTWSRTPEQLSYFNAASVNEYSVRQKKIVKEAIEALKPGGLFIYITCSVFREENENVVDYLISNQKMELLEAKHIYGYHEGADSLFTALLRKPSSDQ